MVRRNSSAHCRSAPPGSADNPAHICRSAQPQGRSAPTPSTAQESVVRCGWRMRREAGDAFPQNQFGAADTGTAAAAASHQFLDKPTTHKRGHAIRWNASILRTISHTTSFCSVAHCIAHGGGAQRVFDDDWLSRCHFAPTPSSDVRRLVELPARSLRSWRVTAIRLIARN